LTAFPVRAIEFGGTCLLAGVLLALPKGLHPFGPFFFSLAGLFVVSLISNATPFFGASYTLIATSELISFGFSIEAFVLIVGITAVGAALGKLVIYGSARGFKRQLLGNKNVQLLHKWMENRQFFVALFVTAVIPLLPLDDYIFIGAGASKGKLTEMLAVTTAAKLVKSAVEIYLEYFGILRIAQFTHKLLGMTSLELSLVLSLVFIVLGVFLFKYDWEKLIGRFQRKPQPGV